MGNPNWKSIETAPKSGKAVILWLPKIEGEQEERWVLSHWYNLFGVGCWSNKYNNGPGYNQTWVIDDLKRIGRWKYTYIKPSHWMDVSPP